ncbi:MAG: acyl-CoA dehydrogenase [Pseudohongiellaceae bacterium]
MCAGAAGTRGGSVVEWGLEQNVRDARIAQIYEGANGIQALDLTGRKTVRANGELLQVLLGDMEAFIASQQEVAGMQTYLPILADCKKRLEDVTATVIANAAENPDEIGAASYAYMELMGLSLYCFMWQRILAAALAAREAGDSDTDFIAGLISTGEFFFSRMLPRADSLVQEIRAGSASLMAMRAEQF